MTKRMTDAEAEAVIERSDGMCERCGARPGQQIHHRRPRGMGGDPRSNTHSAGNLMFMDADCHRLTHADPAGSSVQGWMVPKSEQQPETVEVLYRGEWRWLNDDGTTSECDRDALVRLGIADRTDDLQQETA